MEDDLITSFIALIFSAFFSGMEIAFVSLNRMQLELDKRENSINSKAIAYLYQRTNNFITTMLVGNTIALVVYGYYLGRLLTHILEFHFSIEHDYAVTFQTFISTMIVLLFAEFMPKAFFNVNAHSWFRIFAIPAFLIYIVLYPVVQFVLILSHFIFKFFVKPSQDLAPVEFKEELSFYLSEKMDELDEENIDSEVQIFKNALEFSKVKAKECMIPRKEIVAVNLDEKIEVVKSKFVETGFSKILVYKENIDDIIGYVHVFDFFKQPREIKKILHPVEIVHENTNIRDVLNRLNKKRKSIAVVLDEYGGTSGIITKEDIIEELFGEIEDEHDKVQITEKILGEKEYLFSARLEVDYLNETYDLQLPESDEYETLGGLIMHYHEDIPEVGESIQIGNYTITIQSVQQGRIIDVKLVEE